MPAPRYIAVLTRTGTEVHVGCQGSVQTRCGCRVTNLAPRRFSTRSACERCFGKTPNWKGWAEALTQNEVTDLPAETPDEVVPAAAPIFEQVFRTLDQTGWTSTESHEPGADAFVKRVHSFEPAGTLSNGTRMVYLEIDPSGRWLSRKDGWGTVQKDVDLREFSDPLAAIEAVLAEP